MSDNLVSISELEKKIEALLFVSGNAVPLSMLSEVLECGNKEVDKALENLNLRYVQSHGLRIQMHLGRAQITTAPEYSKLIECFLGLEATSRLSKAALETMAIIAYRNPITRPSIESIRGVNSDGVLHSLLTKGLIQEVGRSDGPGRPILYSITNEFLQQFGLNSIYDLPPYEIEEEQDNNQDILKD